MRGILHNRYTPADDGPAAQAAENDYPKSSFATMCVIMIYDTARVEAIRARVAAQTALINSLEARIVKGKLHALEVARHQTADIETFFIRDLERQDRTPDEEARRLSYAEYMLQTWGPYLEQTQEQFRKYGNIGIEVVGA